MKSKSSYTALMASLAFTPLLASETAYQSDRMVITASRISQSIDETLANVTVLDRDDIERSQASDLLDLLKLQAGIDLDFIHIPLFHSPASLGKSRWHLWPVV